MLSYCGNNSSLSEAWVQRGLSPCLLDTVVTGLLFGIAFIFGTAEIIVYKKYSTQVQYIPQRSCLYLLQLFLSVLLVIQAIARLLLLDLLLYNKQLYGYEIVTGTLQAVTWLLSLVLICLERKRLLPSIPTR